MAGLFDGTPLQRPVTCEVCGKALGECRCPRDAHGKVLLPGQQTAVVRIEKRAGAKLVTIVEGLDPRAADLEGILKRLRSRCAAGGTVGEGMIQIQGDQRGVVVEMLRAEGFEVKRR